MGQDGASSEWFSLNEALDTVPLCNNDSYSFPENIRLSSSCHRIIITQHRGFETEGIIKLIIKRMESSEKAALHNTPKIFDLGSKN